MSRRRKLPGEVLDNCLSFLSARFKGREFSVLFDMSVKGWNVESLDIITGRCDVKFVEYNETFESPDIQKELNELMLAWVQDLLKEDSK
jgi:hypothetical protein